VIFGNSKRLEVVCDCSRLVGHFCAPYGLLVMVDE
jgi:hypothetical protein